MYPASYIINPYLLKSAQNTDGKNICQNILLFFQFICQIL